MALPADRADSFSDTGHTYAAWLGVVSRCRAVPEQE